MEKSFQFQKNMRAFHKRIYMAKNDFPKSDEFVFKNDLTIFIPDGEVAKNAALDFKRYLKRAFGINAEITGQKNATVFCEISSSELGENANGYMGRRIEIGSTGIIIRAFDERGLAQALYDLEDRMNLRRAPYLKFGVTEQRPRFSPRMTHSGYAMDEFPDEYLLSLAHEGFDAVITYVNEHHRASGDYDEINDLAIRAKKFGIDTYLYCNVKNFNHPSDEGAKEIYDEIYGTMFRKVPDARGIIFVGESIEFPSKDPMVAPRRYSDLPADGIPDGKISPGWWPCKDYPEWISLVRDSVRAVSPDADIVFWTYNFGYVEAKYRIELINALPTDITLLVTYEMFDKYKMGEGEGMVMDYTISQIGPGEYFKSEAEVAKKRGIKLYSQVNTGGKTWDFGTVPYEPFPYQWNERHRSLIASQEKYGLSGLMESHHYGTAPSFITRIAKNNFSYGGVSFDEYMSKIAIEFAGEDVEVFTRAMKLIDESIKYYVPSDENQYGPYRIGPAYPLCLATEQKFPQAKGAANGNRIYFVYGKNHDGWGAHDPYSLRIKGEIEASKKCLKKLKEGISEMRKIKNRGAALGKLLNLAKYMELCHVTAINAKQFYIERYNLLSADTKPKLAKAIANIEKIALREIENAKRAIPLLEFDSSLGFECSMDYQGGVESVKWKIRQVEYMLSSELPVYKKAIDPSFAPGKYFKFS